MALGGEALLQLMHFLSPPCPIFGAEDEGLFSSPECFVAAVSPFACLAWFHFYPGASARPKGRGGKCPLVPVDQQMLALSSLARLSQVPFPAFILFILSSLVPPMLGRANQCR